MANVGEAKQSSEAKRKNESA